MIVEQLRATAKVLAPTSRLAVATLEAAADEAAKGPAWLPRLEAASRARKGEPDFETPLAFLAALRGELRRLDALDSDAASPRRLRQVLDQASQTFWTELGLDVEHVGLTRAAAWMVPAALQFVPEGRPFHLVEFEAADGLRLVADRGRPSWQLPAGGPGSDWSALGELVLSRRGFSPRPVPPDASRLERSVLADRPELWDAARPALDAWARATADGSLTIFRAEPEEAAIAVAEGRPEGEAVLVFNARPLMLGPLGHKRVEAALGAALAGREAVWAEAQPRPDGYDLTVRRLVGGKWDGGPLARYGPVPERISWAGGR